MRTHYHGMPLSLVLFLTVTRGFGGVFTASTTVGAGDTTWKGQDIVVSNCTRSVNGPHAFASLVLIGPDRANLFSSNSSTERICSTGLRITL